MSKITTTAEGIEELSETSSRTEKKEILKNKFLRGRGYREKLAVLTADFDDAGLGPAKVVRAAALAEDVDEEKVKQERNASASVTEAVKKRSKRAPKPFAATEGVDSVEGLVGELERVEGASGDAQVKRLASAFQSFEEPWVISHALLGDVSTGVTHKTIAAAAGEMEGYDSSIVKRGRALHPETKNLVRRMKTGDVIDEPKVGKPFKPMKAKSVSPPTDVDDWLAQAKLDGYRCIIHVKTERSDWDDSGVSGRARAFTSSMNEKTGILPELQEIEWPEGKWIFDAEVVAGDNSYTSTSERMQREGNALDLPHTMNFWVFDVIVAAGEDVSRIPFEKRLDMVFNYVPMDDRVKPVHGFEDFDQAEAEARRRSFEGLIVKGKDHAFQFGKRSNDWRKAKFMNETVDLRVAGFQEGDGRNDGVLGAIEVETEDGVGLGKVGTGFTDRKRKQIWENRQDYEGRIVEISCDADEGYEDGLRFPAFEQFRDDKIEADGERRVENILG